MKKLSSLSFLIIAIFILTSCNDEFMDRFPETQIGTENFFNTEDDLNLYINNLYSFPNTGAYQNDGYFTTDNAANTGSTELKTMMITEPNATTVQGGWNWGRLRTINLFLENFGRADIPAENLAHFEGLARYFRATFYMGMVKRYSDVPWYDEVIETGDEEALFKGRDPRDFVVDKIFEDFQFAVDNVFENQPSGAIHKMFVKAEMARAALYEGTFRKYHPELNLQNTANGFLEIARDQAKDIMDSGRYDIFSTGTPEIDYYNLFVSSNLTGNPEVIFTNINEFQVKDSGNSETIFGNYEVAPGRDLLQSYLMADGTYYTDQPDFETKQFVEEFQNRDPRLSQTYAYPGWILIRTGTYAQGGGVYVQQLNKNFSGYHQIKGYVNSTDNATVQDVDYPVFRYAEILLTYAEARAELGELTQTDLDISINKLRDRVGMPQLTMGVKIDPVQQARYPEVSDPVLLEIRRERRVEMALEGYRFDDLMRWSAGKLLEKEPEGMYFPSLGKYDLTGDGVEDIFLIDVSETIPSGEDKEVNSLGVPLIYYRASLPDGDGGVYLENGTSGTVQTVNERGTFVEPKYYYRPIPAAQVTINPNLEQMFGWN
jgi:hypothetical protein